jgi:hypothetical protein
LAAILLLPVPALAITWATDWNLVSSTNIGNGTPVLGTDYGRVTNQADWFFFLPHTVGAPTSISVTRDFSPAAANPGLSAQVLLNNLNVPGTGFHMQIWTTDPSNNVGNIIGTSTTTADTGGNPPNNPNQFGMGPSLNSNTTYTLHVIFSIDSGWSYQVSSTNHQIVTTFAD